MNKEELQEKIDDAVSSTHSWLQDAVSDMAYYYENFVDDEWKEKIEKAKKDGVVDIEDWLANEYYNDVNTMQDLSVDYIHDKATKIIGNDNLKHTVVVLLICKKIQRGGHTALIEAMENLIRDKQRLVEKLTERNKEFVKLCVDAIMHS